MSSENTTELKVNISKEELQRIIEAKISTVLIDTVSSQQDLIGNFVAASLNQKVQKSNGKEPDRYSSKKDLVPYIQWLVEDGIRKSTRLAVSKWMELQKPVILKEVQSQLSKNSNSIINELSKALVNGIEGSIKTDIKFGASVSIGQTDDLDDEDDDEWLD